MEAGPVDSTENTSLLSLLRMGWVTTIYGAYWKTKNGNTWFGTDEEELVVITGKPLHLILLRGTC